MIVDINAVGSHVHPVLIFRRVHFKIDMLNGASTVSIGGPNPTGWSNWGFVFDYLKHFMSREISGKEDRVRLILDKQESQLSIAAIFVPNE
jgi:hypothetical protein